ncbi:4-hydroxythreonine-4-phosphate dehydrogenase PdxA [Apibacter muscae]|uniref:4-hydroxythreonine-4-phosphate dehydrogenase PdxA n=1 Tax=Apibacter muscae TaxID=2509004 RepID=UPI0011ACE59F|nr:4-hydroxythreonine-4-phosphate dehydrogenase PdxA [Apibacter muscae]TWP24762.1 4-hydroxythreonine-4-phosphate dehydrogenase PdxA [Apibacter muscae]
MSLNNKLKVGISLGNPNDIGIEIILKTFQKREMLEFFTPVIFGSTKLLSQKKKKLGYNSIFFQGIASASEIVHKKINVVNVWKDSADNNNENLIEEFARLANISFTSGIESLKQGQIDLLIIDSWSNSFLDGVQLLEVLKNDLGGSPYDMILNENLRISFVNRGGKLNDFSQSLKKEDLSKYIKLINKTLVQDFCIEKPKIAVLGVNNFSQDVTLIGKEELKIIEPSVKECFERGILAFGPYSADSFFENFEYKSFDAVLAMNEQQVLAHCDISFKENNFSFVGGTPYIVFRLNQNFSDVSNIEIEVNTNNSFEQAIFSGIKIYKDRKEYIDLKTNSLKKVKIDGIDMSLDEDLPDEE